jgi:hypothetical protein
MLTVVDNQQQPPRSQELDQHLSHRPAPRLHPNRPSRRLGHRQPVTQAGQLDQPDPIRETGQKVRRHLYRQAGLAHPPHTRERHQREGRDPHRHPLHVALAPDKHARLSHQVRREHLHRPQRREDDRKARRADLKHPLRDREISQPVVTQVHHHRPRGHPVREQPRRHRRADHLPPMRGGHQTGSPIDRKPEVIPVALFHLPRVQTHAHPQAGLAWPHMLRQRPLNVTRCQHCIRCPGKGDPETVSTGRKNIPTMTLNSLTNNAVVKTQYRPHRIRRGLPQARRPFDIREEERHSPRRTTHAPSMTRQMATGSISGISSRECR